MKITISAIQAGLWLLLLLVSNAYAQEQCGTPTITELYNSSNPNLAERTRKLEAFTKKMLQHGHPVTTQAADTIIIPIVFHVVHNTPAQNVPDSLIEQQVSILNDAYLRANANLSLVPPVFLTHSANFKIKFVLAPWQDQHGRWHPLITRTNTTKVVFSDDDEVKRLTHGHEVANPAEYLNVWVTNLGRALLGYATFPGGEPDYDGVVIDYRTFGQPTRRTGRGKTLVHEIGHYLNLYHIWGDKVCGDDQVADTPQQYSANAGKPRYPHRPFRCDPLNSHGDMFMNYMDYTDDTVMAMFTHGQRDRAMATLAPGGPRETLLHSGYLATTNPIMLPNCPCSVPMGTHVAGIWDTQVQINWLPDPNNAKNYEVRYREAIGGVWTTLPPAPDNFKLVTGLNSFTGYLFQVRSQCLNSGLLSDWRSLAAYTGGAGLCPDLDVETIDITASSIDLLVHNFDDYDQVVLRYKKNQHGAPYTSVTLTSQFILLEYLTGNTEYVLEFEAFCRINDGGAAGFSGLTDYETTLGCNPPEDLDYDNLSPTGVEFNWTSRNAFATYDFRIRRQAPLAFPSVTTSVLPGHQETGLVANANYTWAVRSYCGFGYSDWVAANMSTNYCPPPPAFTVSDITNHAAKLTWGAPPVPAAAAVTGFNYSIREDGKDPTVASVGPTTHITHLTDLKPGTKYIAKVEAACAGFGGTSAFLEHTFYTAGCALDALLIENITTNAAHVSYANIQAGAQVNLRYRETGTAAWQETFMDADPAVVVGRTFSALARNTNYEVEVQLICPNGVTGPIQYFYFTTLDCPLVTELGIDFEFTSGNLIGTASWAYGAGEPEALQITLVNLATGNPEIIRHGEDPTIPFFVFNNLDVGTTYRVHVNSICDGDLLPGPDHVFTTPHPATLRVLPEEQQKLIQVTPNPANNRVTIQFLGQQQGPIEVNLFDSQGLPMTTYLVHDGPVINANITELPPGLYFIQLVHNGGEYYDKFIKL